MAILLSCMIYGHYISDIGVIGVTTVFLALFLRVHYSNQRIKRRVIQETGTLPGLINDYAGKR